MTDNTRSDRPAAPERCAADAPTAPETGSPAADPSTVRETAPPEAGLSSAAGLARPAGDPPIAGETERPAAGLSTAREPESRTALDRRRRTWLIATSVLGGAGGMAAVVPLVGSLGPSARVRAAAAPLEVDIGALAPGQVVTVAWRGVPVWIVNRTAAMLAEVDAATPRCADPQSLRPYALPLPDYCRNTYRSRAEHPNIAVLVGICTHLGCTPVPRFAAGAQPNLPTDWPGGWLCPCHGSTFDLAGRVFRDQPAPRNLDVPRYRFLTPTRLVIGRDEHGEA